MLKPEKAILTTKIQRLQNENKLLRQHLDEKQWLPVAVIALVGVMIGLLLGIFVSQEILTGAGL
ncbi:hypothetical protein [Lactobacillus sp. PSON]|uniref:hypothetical protein n=1 Tax=Lactobacillus sp. PSON TaxID=3455454 RepID=UPI004042552D